MQRTRSLLGRRNFAPALFGSSPIPGCRLRTPAVRYDLSRGIPARSPNTARAGDWDRMRTDRRRQEPSMAAQTPCRERKHRYVSGETCMKLRRRRLVMSLVRSAKHAIHYAVRPRPGTNPVSIGEKKKIKLDEITVHKILATTVSNNRSLRTTQPSSHVRNIFEYASPIVT